EFITAQAGLGYIIMFASSAGETATVLAAIVLLCGIGLALYGIVALGELALLRWYGGETTPPMPGHRHPPFGIGAIPIRGITLRYPNARYRGNPFSSDDPDSRQKPRSLWPGFWL